VLELCREGDTECWFSVLLYINILKHTEEKRAKSNRRIGEGRKKNIYLLQFSYVPPVFTSRKGSNGNEVDSGGRAV